MKRNRWKEKWNTLDEVYRNDYVMFQDHLQHLTRLLIFLNISLFFLTELVTKYGYYFTFYSLVALACVQIALILPLGLMRTLKSYCFFLSLELIAVYFFVSSVIYWVITNRI